MADPETDPEDVIQSPCFIVYCIAANGKIFFDRVYKTVHLAQKRAEYLSKISGERGKWHLYRSDLGN